MINPDRLRQDHSLATMGVFGWLRNATSAEVFSLLGWCVPWFGFTAALLCMLGLGMMFLIEPVGQLQGRANSAILAMLLSVGCLSVFIFLLMGFWMCLGRMMNVRIADAMVSALAPTGAIFAFLAFWTGLLWGKSSTGAWWIWDILLISELVLLFLYLIYLGVQIVLENQRWAGKAGALLVITGTLGVPVVYFIALQPGRLSEAGMALVRGVAALDGMSLMGMLLTLLGVWAYSMVAVLMRVRCILLEQERRAHWTNAYSKGQL